MFIPWEI